VIRLAAPADVPAIRALLEAAFPIPAEADLVEALRDANAMVIELVFRERPGMYRAAGPAPAGERAALGYVAFSAMRAPVGTLGLAPVAVAPELRGRGIATALVREGLARAEAGGWRGVFVLGEPGYYQRFGFTRAAAAGFESKYPASHLLGLALAPGGLDPATGALRYAAPIEDLA